MALPGARHQVLIIRLGNALAQLFSGTLDAGR
jgi:hypothetical protein